MRSEELPTVENKGPLTDGRVQDSRIQSSSGSRELDRAAVNALSLCKFQPAMNGGTAEAGWAQLAYVWTLE